MIKKVTNFTEALDAIENIDKQISELLDSDSKYIELMNLMQKRLVYVSELTRLKDKNKVTEEITQRIKRIFDSANSVQEKVKSKRDKLKSRLDKNNKLIRKNKKLNYQ